VLGPDGRPAPGGGTEAGFALAAAVFALLILSALAAGAFYAAFEEVRIGRNSRAAEAAFEAAEAGLGRAAADGPPGGWGAMPVGDSSLFTGALPAGTGRFSGAYLRLSGQLFLIRSTGTDAAGEGQRTVAALARLDSTGVSLPAALVAGGRVVLGRGSLLDGRDSGPPGWSGCPAAGERSLPGLALPGAGDLEDAACGSGCIAGDPPVRADPALAEAAPLQAGGADWVALARLAGKTYAVGGLGLVVVPSPSQSGAACDRSAPDNWGEPARPPAVAPCAGYFPVIHATGDLTMAGGRGQGVLLVDGDLVLTGAAEFDGLVMVRGSLRAVGAGGRIRGGVVVTVTGGALAASLEGASITYSGCALAAALREASPARLIPERSWSELF
jgi:hypothetical protein